MAGYLKTYLLTLLLAVLLVAGLNVFIDPYRLFGFDGWPGLNVVKPYSEDKRKLAKAILGETAHARGLILGNSRAEVGFDPKFGGWPVQPIASLASAGLYPDEVLAYLIHAAHFQNPEVVVLGLDFANFAQGHDRLRNPDEEYVWAVLPDGRPNPGYGWEKLRGRLLDSVSLNTFWNSLGTIRGQRDPYARDITREGFNPMRDYIRLARDEGYAALFRQRDVDFSNTMARARKLMPSKAAALRNVIEIQGRIVDFCRTHGIRLIMVIYPYHADYLEILQLTGMTELFDDFRQQLATLVATRGDESTELWDFSGFNHLTTEPVPADGDRSTEVKWYWEAGHFKKELGDLILGRVFGSAGTDPNFGVRLRGADIHGHLEALRQDEESFRREHPEAIHRVRQWVRGAQ